jgi:hypothetical protein
MVVIETVTKKQAKAYWSQHHQQKDNTGRHSPSEL